MSRRRQKACPCPTPVKTRFSTEERAAEALAAIARMPAFELDGPRPCRSYPCSCGGWHLTSSAIPYANRPWS